MPWLSNGTMFYKRIIRIAQLKDQWNDSYAIAKLLLDEGYYARKNTITDNVRSIRIYIDFLQEIRKAWGLK